MPDRCPYCGGIVWRNHLRIAACANAACAWIERPSSSLRWLSEDDERKVKAPQVTPPDEFEWLDA